jgi:hypothetical protein
MARHPSSRLLQTGSRRRRSRPSGSWLAERLEDRRLLAGDVSVSALLNGPQVDAEVEPNDTRETAIAIASGVPTSGTIARNDIDLFRLTPAQGGRLGARVYAEGTAIRLSLLDEQGRLLVQSDGISPGNRDTLIDQHVTAGTYYLRVEGLSPADVSYTLATELTAASAPFQRIELGEGGSPNALVHGDFNRDGILDLAIASASTNEVAVLLGRGDGSFQDPVRAVVGDSPGSLVAGDFDGDGRLDLATANRGSDDVSVLLGLGDGSFREQVRAAVGGSPASLVAGDIDGDGRTDLATANRASGDVTVLLGRGNGSFQEQRRFSVGFGPVSLVMADLNGDGRPDLTTANLDSGDVAVLLGRGDGSFQEQSRFAVGDGPLSLVVEDFNGDGRTDLAIANFGSSDVTVLLGYGDGSFQEQVRAAVGGSPASLVAGDFDGDGRTDLATANAASGDVTVLLGTGDGLFREQVRAAVGGSPASLVAGDFDGDGRTDLATANASSGDVSVLLGRGDGSFQEQAHIATGDSPSSIVAGDLDGDGRTDLATTNAASGDVAVLLGRGDGTFQEQVRFVVGGSPRDIVTGDFNGDGRTDLATANAGSDDVSVLLGRGDGTFQGPVPIAVGNTPSSIVVGDFNGDGRPDLATANAGSGDVSVLLSRGDGTFQEQVRFAAGDSPSSIVAGDFNGDGRTDLAIANAGSGDVAVLLGRGDGTFQDQVRFAAGDSPSSIVAGDYNGDGRTDLAASHGNSAEVLVLMGNGDGSFQGPVRFPVEDAPRAIVMGDFNGDGRPDFATVNEVSNEISVGLNLGGGTFASPGSFATAFHATPIVADLDHDGAVDVLVLDQAGEILWRLGRPQAPGTFEPPIVVNLGAPSRDIAVLDSYQGSLVASVDARANAISLFTRRDGRFVRVGSLLTGRLPAQIAAADLDGDGAADLVVRNAGDGSASIYLGDGFGNFRKLLDDLPLGLGTSDLRLADVDQSGSLDLIVTNQFSGDVRILFNGGDATFTQESRYYAGSGLYGLDVVNGTPNLKSLEETAGLAVGTFTRREVPGVASANPLPVLDLVTINPGSNTLGVLVGLSGGAFANPRRVVTDGPVQVIRVADFNGDGVSDVALLGSGRLTISQGDGQGGFAARFTIDAGLNPTGLSIADANQDGRLDLLVGNDLGDVLVLLGDGDGTFRPDQRVDRVVALAVADLDSDGRDDFVFANQARDRVSVMYSDAGPIFVEDRSNGLLAPGAVALADLNLDDFRDLIVANSGSNNVLVYTGLGNGLFSPGRSFFAGTNPVGITVADVNGDGVPDLVVANRGSNDVSILLGQGRGDDWTLDLGPRLQTGIGPVGTVVYDVDGDFIPDLVVSDSQSNDVRIVPGIGLGFFADRRARIIPVGFNPGPPLVGNFDGRPGLDLVTLNRESNDLTLVPDFVGGTSLPLSLPSGGLSPVAGLSSDFNSDGISDLVVANNTDGRLALFLGGDTGLDLAQVLSTPDLPHPTALAFASVGEGLISFYASTEGQETATLLAFSFGGGVGPVGSVETGGGGVASIPPPQPPPSPGLGSPDSRTPSATQPSDLVVAEIDNRLLAMFLGPDTSTGLLAEILSSPALLDSTTPVFGPFGDGQWQFDPDTEEHAVTPPPDFTVGGDDGSSPLPGIVPGTGSGSTVTPDPGATQQLAQLVPLHASALALVATLLTVGLNMPTTEADAAAVQDGAMSLATFSATTTPTQGVSQTEDQDGVADEAKAEEAPADKEEVPQPEKVPAWIRFIAGLDEAFDRQRQASLDDLPGGAGSPSLAARVLDALDAVLHRLAQDTDRSGLAERLRQVALPTAKAIDAAIDLLWSEDVPAAPPATAPAIGPAGAAESQEDGTERPEETEPEDVSAATVPLVLVAALMARCAGPQHWRQRRRGRSGTLSQERGNAPPHPNPRPRGRG